MNMPSSDGLQRCLPLDGRGRAQGRLYQMLTPEEASIRARIGAYALHAKYDSTITTAKARAAFAEKFLDEVDPDRVLPEHERLRRAEFARKAHFQRMALQSVRSRSAKRRLAATIQ